MDRLMSGQGFPFDKIYIIACGTSYHAGMVGKYLIESFARIRVSVDQASEFRYRNPILDKNTLVVAISQSGETADTLAAIQQARKEGSKILSICNVIDSSIPRASHETLYTQAGPEIGVASTKAFVTQLVVMILLSLEWAWRRGEIKQCDLEKAVQDLTQLPDKIRQALELNHQIEKISRRYTDTTSCLFFARGIHYPISLEGALKLKEISYIHAEGYSAGEMKHGPIALIDRGFPVVVLAPQDNLTYEKVLGNIEEVRARGAEVISIATEDDNVVPERSDYTMFLPRVPWYLQPVLEVIPLQLLAYHIADHKGTDVDQPRNLAKSVTVE
jgi:glucosamine--fructose-6-phosphate aminotransferase (isomerizing)